MRFYLTNTANTRVFKVALPGARMKLVGGDSGHFEHEEFVDDVILAPSERVVVDVLFDEPGELTLEHRTPERIYPLAAIRSARSGPSRRWRTSSSVLRTNADMAAERERIAPYLEAEPDKTLAFVAEMDMGAPEGDGPVVYACPMHPEVVSDEPGHCPKCGMKLLAAEAPATTYVCPMHPSGQRQARPLPEVRDEAAAGAARRPRPASARARWPRHARHGHGITTGGHDHGTSRPAGSSGKTTWSRSTG